MSILGIDYEKCNLCKNCVNECPSYFSFDADQKKVVFSDPDNLCSRCNRCRCRCPEDAILDENMEDVLTFEGVQDPSTLISYETLNNFMTAKRSIRRYKKNKVPKDVMEKILTSMTHAPTGANIRTLRCKIISDENTIKQLSDSVMDVLIASSNAKYGEGAKLARERGFDAIFYHAPHVLIMHSKNPGDAMNSTIALTRGMLSAQSLGLGSCWIGLAHGVLTSHKDIKEKIAGIKGNVWGVIIIGYPAQRFYHAPPRPMIRTKGLDELD
ncbi:MAG: nitroreductase family protein [Candidatus Lokiarchaeota archaeon]|nr:nitroreductase family protein [Candidatus Lokiarchaeota archaeon]